MKKEAPILNKVVRENFLEKVTVEQKYIGVKDLAMQVFGS